MGPHLLVVPLSVLSNWESEMRRFAPSLDVHVYRGAPGERADELDEALQQFSREGSRAPPLVVLTTYVLPLILMPALALTLEADLRNLDFMLPLPGMRWS